MPSNGVAEYERQRLSRIEENRSRMKALRLPKIASRLLRSARKVSEKMEEEEEKKMEKKMERKMKKEEKKRKKKGKEKVEDEEGLSSSSGEEEDDEDYLGQTSSGPHRKKVRSLISAHCLCVCV
jgi:recombinational DNA repair ATPase RecF